MERANVSRRRSIIAECFGILKPSMYGLSDVSQIYIICMKNIGIFFVELPKVETQLSCAAKRRFISENGDYEKQKRACVSHQRAAQFIIQKREEKSPCIATTALP